MNYRGVPPPMLFLVSSNYIPCLTDYQSAFAVNISITRVTDDSGKQSQDLQVPKPYQA